jgi:hypothetical protein
MGLTSPTLLYPTFTIQKLYSVEKGLGGLIIVNNIYKQPYLKN